MLNGSRWRGLLHESSQHPFPVSPVLFGGPLGQDVVHHHLALSPQVGLSMLPCPVSHWSMRSPSLRLMLAFMSRFCCYIAGLVGICQTWSQALFCHATMVRNSWYLEPVAIFPKPALKNTIRSPMLGPISGILWALGLQGFALAGAPIKPMIFTLSQANTSKHIDHPIIYIG